MLFSLFFVLLFVTFFYHDLLLFFCFSILKAAVSFSPDCTIWQTSFSENREQISFVEVVIFLILVIVKSLAVSLILHLCNFNIFIRKVNVRRQDASRKIPWFCNFLFVLKLKEITNFREINDWEWNIWQLCYISPAKSVLTLSFPLISFS